MKIEKTFIESLYVVELKNFEDLRGQLLKPFSQGVYAQAIPLNLNFKETWFTKSHKNVIRAMHLQIEPRACEKLVCVIQGKVKDVILDIRKESPTYGQYFEIELSGAIPKALYIPQGCAHGYRAMEDNTIVMYMATDLHSAEHDLGIRWNSFGYDWGITDPILSEKDKTLPAFEK